MIFRWRLTPLFVLIALLSPLDVPPDTDYALGMEDDGTPIDLINLWLDPIPPVLIIDIPKVHNTLVTPRPRINASRILSICIGDTPDVSTSNIDTATSTCDPTPSVYNLPVTIHETLDNQLPISNNHSLRLEVRHRLKAIMDSDLLFWLDILHWLLRPLVRLFQKKTPPTLASDVQIPRASLRQAGKGRKPGKFKKRALRSGSKRSVVVKDDLCNLLGVLILGSQQVLEVDRLAQVQEHRATAENDDVDPVVTPPGLNISPDNVSMLKTTDTSNNNMDTIGSSSEMHLAATSSNDADASPCCRKSDTSGSLETVVNKEMTFEERMRRDVPFLCTDDSDSESDDEEMEMNGVIRDWIKSQTPIKSSVKQNQSSGLPQQSHVLPQPPHCKASSASASKNSSAEALVGPYVAFGVNADNTDVIEEHGLEPGQGLNMSEALLDITGTRYKATASLETDQSLDARGILAGYPKGWWSASLPEETELQAPEGSGNLDFGFESFDVSELVEHLPETCYPRLMDISIGAIERAEVVGDAVEVGTTDIENGDALEASTAAVSSLLEVETAEASSIQLVDSDTFIGALNTSTQTISPAAEEGLSQIEESCKQSIEDCSTTHDEEQRKEDLATLVADKSLDVQDILARYPQGLWKSSILEMSELETLGESGDLDFGFESFDVSELVGPMPEACYQRLMDISIGAIERAEVVGESTEGATMEIESAGAALMFSSADILTHDIIDTMKESGGILIPPANAQDQKEDIKDFTSLEADRSLDVRELMAWYPAHCWNQPLLEELSLQPSYGTSLGNLENVGDLGSGIDGVNVAELTGKWPKGWRDPRLMDLSIGEIRRVAVVDDPVKGVVKVAGSLGQGVVEAVKERQESTVKPVADRRAGSKSMKKKPRKPLTSITNTSGDATGKSRSYPNVEVGKFVVPETALINNETIIIPDEHKILPSGQLPSMESVDFIAPSLALEGMELSETTVDGPSATKGTLTIVEHAAVVPPSCPDEDVRPIYIQSSKELKAAFDRMKPFFMGKETEDNWLKRQKSVDEIRGMLLTKVHVTLKSDFHRNLKVGVLECTLVALASLRTTLSSKAASLYSELAIAMGSSFNGPLIAIVLPSLLKMSGFTKALMVDKTQKTVSDILENGSYQSVYMVSQLVGSYDGERNAKVRTHMMKHIETLLRVHFPKAKGTTGMEQSTGKLERCLLMGLSDSWKEVKEVSRLCFLIYEGLSPKAGAAMRAKMDGKVKKLLEGVASKVDGEVGSRNK